MRKKHLRILSYNIHKGFSSGNRRFVLERMRHAIRVVHADLVFLQEVLGDHEDHRRKHESWPEVSQFEYLADEIWPHFTYGKNAVYTSGHHGNAVLSKYPIVFSENIDVSTSRMEKRGLLHAKIEIPEYERPIHAVCVHLGLRESDRGRQVQRLVQRIESHVPHNHPVIIAGDFNDWRSRASLPLSHHHATTEAFEEAFEKLWGTHARTFPSWLPALKLDRVYYRGMEVKDAEAYVGSPWNVLSDHAALYVELALRAEHR